MATYGTPYTPPRTSPYTLSSYQTGTQGSPSNNLASAFAGGPQNAGLPRGSSYLGTRLPTIAPGSPGPVRAPTPTSAPGSTVAAAAAPTPPNIYDINTDPALQAITALTGMGDEQAQASALKQRQGQLLGYGDPTLAQSVLGDPTIAQAAGANPTSTLAQLGQSRTRNLSDLTEGLNKNNLFYSGYRVTQEQQAAQDYQNALAQAAAGVNTNLDTISGNLSGALAANQAQRIAAMQAAQLQQAAQPAPVDTLASALAPPPDYTAAPVAGMNPDDSFSVANAVQAGAAPAETLMQYVDPNTAAGRYAMSVLQQQQDLAGTRFYGA